MSSRSHVDGVGPVDGCKWRRPRSLWHGLATSSTPTVRPASEPCAERSPSAPDRYVDQRTPATAAATARGILESSLAGLRPFSRQLSPLETRGYTEEVHLSALIPPEETFLSRFFDRYVGRRDRRPDPCLPTSIPTWSRTCPLPTPAPAPLAGIAPSVKNRRRKFGAGRAAGTDRFFPRWLFLPRDARRADRTTAAA